MFFQSNKILSFWEIDKTNTNNDQMLIILQTLKGIVGKEYRATQSRKYLSKTRTAKKNNNRYNSFV